MLRTLYVPWVSEQMPARRPYASRGVQRRSPIRRSGSRVLAQGLLVLAVVVGVVVAGLAWLGSFRPESAMQPLVLRAPVLTKSEPPVQPEAQAPAALEMSNVDATAPTPMPEAPGSQMATPEPTLRQWDASATGIVADPALTRQLDRALAGVDGHIGVAVKDLGTNRGAILNGDLELQSASLYKLPILYSVFAAGLSMAEPLPITDEALSYDAGTMELGPGETLTVAEALERMVTLSDNTSAIMLASRVGAYRINSSITALGMDTTHYSLERMTTSALDMLSFVERVADGDAVSAAASADMLHLMLRQRVNDRLPRLLPAGVDVAHKTGNLPGTVNDVGVLYGPHATVAVAALVSDTSDESAAAAAIAELAQTAYEYFDSLPEVADRPLIPPAPARPIPPVWREPNPPTPTPTPTAEPTEVGPSPTATVAPTHTPPLSTATTAPAHPPIQPPAVAAATSTPSPPLPTATPIPPPPTPTLALPTPTRAPARPAPATPAPPSKH